MTTRARKTRTKEHSNNTHCTQFTCDCLWSLLGRLAGVGRTSELNDQRCFLVHVEGAPLFIVVCTDFFFGKTHPADLVRIVDLSGFDQFVCDGTRERAGRIVVLHLDTVLPCRFLPIDTEINLFLVVVLHTSSHKCRSPRMQSAHLFPQRPCCDLNTPRNGCAMTRCG